MWPGIQLRPMTWEDIDWIWRCILDLELNGKTAIVTGGSRGIGKAIARELAIEGVDVVIAARGREALEATASELAAETGRRIIPVTVDTGDDESVKAMVSQAHEALGRLDILVHNAAVVGGGPGPTLAEITKDHLWADMNVKVMGYLRTAQAVAPLMQAQGWGRIINISGMAARNAGPTSGSMRHWSAVGGTTTLAPPLGPAVDPRYKRAAYHGRLKLARADRGWVRNIYPGSSYLSSIDARAHFGLGSVDEIESLEVLWPDGLRETFKVECLDCAIVVQRGEGVSSP